MKNTKRLIDDCYKSVNGNRVPKTKTRYIIADLENESHQRKPHEGITDCTKHATKTLVIARFGMLECGRNFKSSMQEVCRMCNTIDD